MESPIVAGNEKPVLGSTTVDPELGSARAIDPHGNGEERVEEKTLGFRDATIAAPPTVTVTATAETESLDDDVECGGLGTEG